MKGDGSRPDESLPELAGHRGFVEALARRLVFDQHLAEDLVQETLLAAMQNPPREKRALRAWLARVVRNLAYRTLRTRARRDRREKLAARPEATPPTGDLVARLAWHRIVVDTVLTLPNDMRETLILRFYEDLTPKEIAERQGIPSATVRSRLKRGLALMRERLDDTRGGRKAWTLGLIPLLFPSQPAAAATGGALLGVAAMSAQKKTVMAAAVVLALVGAFVAGRFALRSDADRTERTTRSVTSIPQHKEKTAPVTPSVPIDPTAPTLDVFVRDRFDQPLTGATVEVLLGVPYPERGPWYPSDWAMRRWLQRSKKGTVLGAFTTDADGRATLRGVPVHAIDVRASSEGYASTTQWVWHVTGAITLTLGPGAPLRGQVIDQDDNPVPGAVVLAGPVRPRGNLGANPRPILVVADAAGRYAFPSLPTADRSVWAAFPGGAAVYIASLRFPGVDTFDIRLRRGGTLVGHVTDITTGAPIAGVEVVASERGLPVGFYGRAITDNAGRYRIATMPAGHVGAIVLTKPGWAQVFETILNVELRAGETATLDAKMHVGATVRGRVMSPDGPVAGAGVASMHQPSVGGVVVRNATTDENGRYELRDLPAGNHVLGVDKPGYQDGLKPGDMFGLKDNTKHPSVVVAKPGAEIERDLHVTAGKITIEGVVIGPDGKGFSGAAIGAPGARTKTDKNGAFSLDGVQRQKQGRTFIWVSVKGHNIRGAQPFVPVDVEAMQNVRIELKVAEARPMLTGTVRDTTGALSKSVSVLLARPVGVSARSPTRHRVQAQLWKQAFRAKIDADGRYRMPLPPGKSFLLRAAAPDRAPMNPVKITVEPGRVAYVVDLVLEGGHTLTGKAPPGAHITATYGITGMQKYYASMAGDPPPPISAVADAAGAFSIRHLNEGRWDVEAVVSGFAKATQQVDLPQSRPVHLVPQRLVSIGGVVVYEDGAPAVGARINIWEVDNKGKMTIGQAVNYGLVTDDRGRWRKDGLSPTRFRVDVKGTAAANLIELSDNTVRGGQTSLRLVAQRAMVVRGAVVDANGTGVGGVRLLIQRRSENTLVLVAQGDSAADGTFELIGVPPGIHSLSLVHGDKRYRLDGVKAGSQNLRVTFDPTRDDLGRSDVLTLSGVVIDEGGKPMAKRKLFLSRVDGGLLVGRSATKTDAAGRFACVVASARYRVKMERVRALDAIQHVPLLGEVNARAGLTLVAKRGLSIRGVVKDAVGKPVSNVYVRATVNPANGVTAQTDQFGRFELGGFAKGAACEVIVWRQDFVTDVRHAVPAGSRDVELVLRRGLEATGVIHNREGLPLMKRPVRFIWIEDETRRVYGKTDKVGRFHVKGLIPGRYRVMAHDPERDYQSCGEIEAGASSVRLTTR